jgi:hypothetical protein
MYTASSYFFLFYFQNIKTFKLDLKKVFRGFIMMYFSQWHRMLTFLYLNFHVMQPLQINIVSSELFTYVKFFIILHNDKTNNNIFGRNALSFVIIIKMYVKLLKTVVI